MKRMMFQISMVAAVFLAKFSQDFLHFSVIKSPSRAQPHNPAKTHDTLENIDSIGFYAKSGLVGAEGFEPLLLARKTHHA